MAHSSRACQAKVVMDAINEICAPNLRCHGCLLFALQLLRWLMPVLPRVKTLDVRQEGKLHHISPRMCQMLGSWKLCGSSGAAGFKGDGQPDCSWSPESTVCLVDCLPSSRWPYNA
jgi:hypothetical protein